MITSDFHYFIGLKKAYKTLKARLKNYENYEKPQCSDVVSYVEPEPNDYPRITRSYLENINFQVIANPIISAILVMFFVVYFIILWKFVKVIKKQVKMYKTLMESQKQQDEKTINRIETPEINEETRRDTVDEDKQKFKRKRDPQRKYYYINKFK